MIVDKHNRVGNEKCYPGYAVIDDKKSNRFCYFQVRNTPETQYIEIENNNNSILFVRRRAVFKLLARESFKQIPID